MTAPATVPLAPDAPWVVLKFGGTSVATLERWKTILQLAANRRTAGARVLIVVSALSGVTDALKALGRCVADERPQRVADLHARHRTLAAAMGLADAARVEQWLASLQALAQAGTLAARPGGTEADTYAWQAALQAHGELLSSSLG
ncbi:MAG TPA: bifunctional aspartate kinase/diaminopimelate decarboxylase, partial [Rhodanobacteraceae bacterium]